MYDAGEGNTWNGYRFWMAMTPYANGADALENPSILASADGQTWVVPAGLTNPLAAEPETGHHSDTCLIVDASSKMWVYYRWSNNTDASEVHVISSTDGVTWGDDEIVFSDVVSGSNASPTVVWDGTQWVMWVVDTTTATPNTLVKRTCATPDGTWSEPTNCSVTGVPVGRDMWHLSIEKVGAYYVALVCVTDANGPNKGEMHYMDSLDGETWVMNSLPLMSWRNGTWDNNAIYQSAFLARGNNTYDVWYSAEGLTWEWYIGFTQVQHVPLAE